MTIGFPAALAVPNAESAAPAKPAVMKVRRFMAVPRQAVVLQIFL